MTRFEIRLGPAGNCITAKKPGTEASFERIVELGLNAQEIEFVRSIYLKEDKAKKLGKLAEELDIKLSIHAPYYINLASEKKEVIKKSIQFILASANIGEVMNASPVVVHAAYYLKNDREKTYEIVKQQIEKILEEMEKKKIVNTQIALETMAKQSQFADLDTLIKFIKEINHKQLTICVDWGHMYCLGNGKINYGEIFDKLKKLKLKHIHTHFTNVRYNLNKKQFVDIHEPMNSHPKFEPLAKEILKRRVNITIISETPILEKDSIKMKKIFEKLGYKFKK